MNYHQCVHELLSVCTSVIGRHLLTLFFLFTRDKSLKKNVITNMSFCYSTVLFILMWQYHLGSFLAHVLAYRIYCKQMPQVKNDAYGIQ